MIEQYAVCCKFIDVWGGIAGITVASEMVGPAGVNADKYDAADIFLRKIFCAGIFGCNVGLLRFCYWPCCSGPKPDGSDDYGRNNYQK